MEFIVSNLNNSGVGSLRWAIRQANNLLGFDSIQFARSLAGGTISLTSDLPELSDQVEINGLLNGRTRPRIAVDFNGNSGLVFRGAQAEGSVLKGLAIMDAGGDGLTLDAAKITVQSNYIGYGLDGITGSGNTGNGIRVTDRSYGNLIGAIDSLTGKRIGHNFSNQIGNNGASGILISGSTTNTIARNQISTQGNGGPGIKIMADVSGSGPTSQIRIRDNRISTDGPLSSGIEVIVSRNGIESLAIVGNTVVTEGAFSAASHGVAVRVRQSGLVDSLDINSNDVSTTGPLSQGIFLSCTQTSKIIESAINSNTVSTSGSVPSDKNRFDLESDGIYVNVQQSEIQQIDITENSVTTRGNDADGIYLISGRSSVIQDALLLGNTISVSGNNPINGNQVAEGIKILSFADASIASVSLTDNTILEAEGDGILLKAQSAEASGGGYICANLRGNTSTSGQSFGTAYNAANPGNQGVIALVGEDFDDIVLKNSPSEPSAYSSSGTILFVPACG